MFIVLPQKKLKKKPQDVKQYVTDPSLDVVFLFQNL